MQAGVHSSNRGNPTRSTYLASQMLYYGTYSKCHHRIFRTILAQSTMYLYLLYLLSFPDSR